MPETPHVALVNDLCATSVLEMSILTHALFASPIGGHIKLIVGPAAMMTGLDVHGVSVSMMELGNGDAELLAQPVRCPGWPVCHTVQMPRRSDAASPAPA